MFTLNPRPNPKTSTLIVDSHERTRYIAPSALRLDIREAFARVVRTAGLNPREITMHTLRHTVVTHLVQGGVDLPTVGRISGHKTLQMVARYSHQNGEHIQEAMNRLQERVG